MTSLRLELLKWYRDIGCDVCYEDGPNAIDSAPQEMAAPVMKSDSDIMPRHVDKLQMKPQAVDHRQIYSTFDSLIQGILEYDGCALKKTALNTVIYEGALDAKVLLVGEAPGATEDKEGRPFCGQSGKLLDNIIASIGLDRKKNAFITNAVFWRPPANRRPTPQEIEICKPFLEQIIGFLAPKLIILVGSTATESLLGLKASMNSLRQESFLYKNEFLSSSVDVEVIFHPSYLLRQPLQKKAMWLDMLKIQQKYFNTYS